MGLNVPSWLVVMLVRYGPGLPPNLQLSEFQGFVSSSPLLYSLLTQRESGTECGVRSNRISVWKARGLKIGLSVVSLGCCLAILEVACWWKLTYGKPPEAYVKRWDYRQNRPLAYQSAAWYCREFVNESFQCVRWNEKGSLNYFTLADFDGKLFHVVDGRRQTTDQPDHAAHTLYVIGGSTTFGQEVPDQETLCSHLQRQLNAGSPNEWRVENLGTPAMTALQHFVRLRETPLAAGDLVIFYDGVNDVYYPIYNGQVRGADIKIAGDGGVRRMTWFQRQIHRAYVNFSTYSHAVRVLCDVNGHVLPHNLVDHETCRKNSEAAESSFREALAEARTFVESRGGRFLHVLQPHLFCLKKPTPNERWLTSNELKGLPGLERAFEIGYPRLRQACRDAAREGVHTVDLSDVLDNRPAGHEVFLDFCHVNHVANWIIATHIAQHIVSPAVAFRESSHSSKSSKTSRAGKCTLLGKTIVGRCSA